MSNTAYANEYDYYIYFQHIASGTVATFKAFITDFDDQYTSEWNDVKVYGRMDPISTFQGTSRVINFSFDVIAEDVEEALINFENSRRLIQCLYPVYEEIGAGNFSATSIQAPPLMKIRFANLIQGGLGSTIDGGLVGKLDGVSYKPEFEAGVFEKTGDGQILPKLNRFSCNFTVFHTDKLGFS